MAAAVLTRMPEIAKVDADLAHELERSPGCLAAGTGRGRQEQPRSCRRLGAAGARIATPPVACVGQDLTGRVPLVLPSGQSRGFHQPIRACAEQCFRELAEHRELFNRGGSLAELRVEHGQAEKQFMTLHPVTPDGFRSRVERHFLPWRTAPMVPEVRAEVRHGHQGPAQALLASREMQVLLPAIVGLSGCLFSWLTTASSGRAMMPTPAG